MANDDTRIRLSRLPVWAQQRIEALERDVNYWRSQAEEGPENSNTFVHSYTDRGENGGQPLGENTDIRFELDEGREFLVHIESGALQIYAGGLTGGDISVRPMSSNTVRLEIVKR